MENTDKNLTSVQKERKMLLVIIFTIFAMAVEIFFGYITKSMSLLAEGVHMSVHVLTLGLTYIAYIAARKLKDSLHFKNGTSKIGVLAGYTSAIFLALTGLGIFIESVKRFITPEDIQFNEAICVAIFALVINYICISIMEGNLKLHNHDKNDKDYNYKAAYYHILSDLLVSILTIFALVIGKYTGFVHLDALTGIFGTVLIFIWSVKLIRNTVRILIDMK